MSRALSIFVVGVLAGSLLPATALAETFTFGSSLPEPSPGYYDSCSDDCTTAQIDLPGAQVTSPVSGTVVRFRLRTAAGSDPHKIKFRILRSAGGEKFIGAGTSKGFDIPTTAGITTFDVNMPIKQGDIIGIDEPGGGKRANVVAINNGAFQGGWFPALEDYSKARPSGNPRGSSPTVFELLLQAEVESEAADCTNNKQVATCPDSDGQPSMCSAKTANYPQCSMAGDLPSACSGTGTGLPVCNLPGNHIVACGGFGLNLPVCNLPPNQVPGVCGPVTLGFQPCTVSNNQVQACGPVSLGLPQCNFKGPIPGRAPIEPSGGEVDTKVSCPPYVLEPSEADCRVYVAIAPLIDAKRNALWINATRIAEYYRYAWNYVPESKWGDSLDQIKQDAATNAGIYLYTRASPLLEANFFPYRRKVPLSPLTPAEKTYIFDWIYHPFSSHGPPELWQNSLTKYGATWRADAMDKAIDELVTIAQSKGRGASARALAQVSQSDVRPARAVFKGRFKVKRKAKRIHIDLSRKAVRKLTKRLPKKERVAPVRMVVAFKAKPRPIVRYVDFGLKIKR